MAHLDGSPLRWHKAKSPMVRGFSYLAERAGFEPALGYYPKHAFQACDLNRSSTSPKGGHYSRVRAGFRSKLQKRRKPSQNPGHFTPDRVTMRLPFGKVRRDGETFARLQGACVVLDLAEVPRCRHCCMAQRKEKTHCRRLSSNRARTRNVRWTGQIPTAGERRPCTTQA